MQITGPGVLLSSHDVHMLTKVLALSAKTAHALEADKNIMDHPEAVEVRLLMAIAGLDEECSINVKNLREAVGLPILINED